MMSKRTFLNIILMLKTVLLNILIEIVTASLMIYLKYKLFLSM